MGTVAQVVAPVVGRGVRGIDARGTDFCNRRGGLCRGRPTPAAAAGGLGCRSREVASPRSGRGRPGTRDGRRRGRSGCGRPRPGRRWATIVRLWARRPQAGLALRGLSRAGTRCLRNHGVQVDSLVPGRRGVFRTRGGPNSMVRLFAGSAGIPALTPDSEIPGG